LFSTCLAFFTAAAGCAVVLGVGFYLVALDWFLNVPADVASEFRVVFWLLLGSFALTLPLSIFPAILDGLNLFAAKGGIRTVILFLIRVPLTLAVLPTERCLVNLAWVITGCTLLEHVILAGLVFRRLPGLQFRFQFIDRSTFRMVRGYSV